MKYEHLQVEKKWQEYWAEHETFIFDSVYDTFLWVSPFGNLRIKVHLQLPEAYRSLSRPSSAPDAKAFPLRSY